MKFSKPKLIIFLTVLLIVIFAFSFICCRPVESGVQLGRNLLKVYGLKTHRLKTNAGYLNYFEGGSGPVMILVHGYIADAGNWYPVVPDLRKKYTLVIPDLPGHGSSDPQTDKLTPEDLLEGILKLIDEKSKNQKVILVGNSLGGWVCLMAALQAQNKISALILENSAGLKTELPERLLLPKDISSAKELYTSLLGGAPQVPDFIYQDLIRYLAQDRFIYLYHCIGDEYFMDDKLKNLSIPVFLFWGTNDKLFDKKYALRMKSEIPESILIMDDSTGHAMHFTRPALFIKNIESVLK